MLLLFLLLLLLLFFFLFFFFFWNLQLDCWIRGWFGCCCVVVVFVVGKHGCKSILSYFFWRLNFTGIHVSILYWMMQEPFRCRMLKLKLAWVMFLQQLTVHEFLAIPWNLWLLPIFSRCLLTQGQSQLLCTASYQRLWVDSQTSSVTVDIDVDVHLCWVGHFNQ